VSAFDFLKVCGFLIFVRRAGIDMTGIQHIQIFQQVFLLLCIWRTGLMRFFLAEMILIDRW